MSGDSWVHDVLTGKVLEFEKFPEQSQVPHSLKLHASDQLALDKAMLEFIVHGIVELCNSTSLPCFYSNVFPIVKPDGTARVILNLSDLNLSIKYVHFKMDTIKDVINLVYPNCFFMTVDFKHAYYSVSVRPEDRRWLRFRWRGESYQFTCLPQGLTSAPRIFTRLLKPVLAHLRSLGILVSCYIDDCIFLASSGEELIHNVKYALQLFDALGLTIHVSKSMLVPSHEVTFLGLVLNSVEMSVTLPERKRVAIREKGLLLLRKAVSPLRELASFIGLAVASDLAVPLCPLHYKYLEIFRNRALINSKGNYDVDIALDARSREIISWWVDNVHLQSRPMFSPPPDVELLTDASLTGWGATLGSSRTGGHWAAEELSHINCLELKAVLLGLESLCGEFRDIHVRIRSDNSTTIACIDRVSSTKAPLLDLVERIFLWAESRGITLSSEFIKGEDNVVADKESRVKNIDTEWMLQPSVFSHLCDIFSTPRIDLFASRINAQLPCYVAWRPDPYSVSTNAFTISWANGLCYAFPPFSVISRVLRKLVVERATLLMILPVWPTQVWFPRALQLLSDTPILLPRDCLTLPQDPSHRHPLAAKLVLAAMVLSGNPSRTGDYRRRLQDSSFRPGELERNVSTGVISRDGCVFVSSGKLIRFSQW